MVEMNTLNELTLCCLAELWELPNPTSLCALGSLTIDNCNKLQALPESLQKLRALKQLTLRQLCSAALDAESDRAGCSGQLDN